MLLVMDIIFFELSGLEFLFSHKLNDYLLLEDLLSFFLDFEVLFPPSSSLSSLPLPADVQFLFHIIHAYAWLLLSVAHASTLPSSSIFLRSSISF